MYPFLKLLSVLFIFLSFSLSVFSQSGEDPRVLAIRKEFNLINKSLNNYEEDIILLYGGEGGEIVKYLEEGVIRKMVCERNSVNGRNTFEYYFSNGKLIFAFYKDEAYKEGSMEFKKPDEQRYYFHNNKLFLWKKGKSVVDPGEYETKGASIHAMLKEEMAEEGIY